MMQKFYPTRALQPLSAPSRCPNLSVLAFSSLFLIVTVSAQVVRAIFDIPLALYHTFPTLRNTERAFEVHTHHASRFTFCSFRPIAL
jgi:hypothetical protein